MALPTIVSKGLIGSSSSAIVWTPPSCLEDDILLVWGASANEVFTDPQFFVTDPSPGPGGGSSMNPIGQAGTGTAAGTSAARAAAWWRRMDGTENLGDPFYFYDAGDHQILEYALVRGCIATGTPLEAYVSSLAAAASASVSFPGLTTLGGDRLVLSCVAGAIDTTTPQLSGTPTNADLANVTVQINDATNAGNGSSLAVISGERAVPGVVGNGAGTLLNSTVQARLSFAMIPAISGAADDGGAYFL